jgi:hypothetical protein
MPVELRVSEGGLDQAPRILRDALSSNHAMLADICEVAAAYIDECPPEKVEAFLAGVRKLLRRMARHFLDDMDEIVPEAATYTKAARTHFRLCARDIIQGGPAELRAWEVVHRCEAKRLRRR